MHARLRRFSHVLVTLTMLTMLAGPMLRSAPALAQTTVDYLDQSQTQSENSFRLSTGTDGVVSESVAAQTFRAGLSGPLAKVDLWLWGKVENAESANGPISVEIRDAVGGQPGDTIVAATQITNQTVLDSLPVYKLDGSVQPTVVTVSFATPASVRIGTTYAIVLSTGSDSNYNWAYLLGSVYSHGTAWVKDLNQTTWRDLGGDAAFQTYVTVDPTTVVETTTTAASKTIALSDQAQNVVLSATVTGTQTPSAGTVTFTVQGFYGDQVGEQASASVTDGTATASYTIPANTEGNYTIVADYSGGTGGGYQFRPSNSSDPGGGNGALDIIPIPTNDNFSAAAPFTISTSPDDTWSDYANTRVASSPTEAPLDPTCTDEETDIQFSNSVWYSTQPGSDMTINANTLESEYDTVLGVYTYDTQTQTFTQVACNNDSGTDSVSSVSFQATAGTDYYFMVGAAGNYKGIGGALAFHAWGEEILPVAADDIDSATGITLLPWPEIYSTKVDTTQATKADDDPLCVVDTTATTYSGSVWFRYTATATDAGYLMVASTFNSDYYTVLGIYTGTPDNLTRVACNNDAADDNKYNSLAFFAPTIGTTYYIMVAAAGADASGGTLTFQFVAIPPEEQTSTTTTASPASVDAGAASVSLSADVAVADSNVSAPSAGTVSFTIKNKTTGQVIGTPPYPVNVVDGKATIDYPIPANTPAGSYAIEAVYSGGPISGIEPSFYGSSSGSNTLTITAPASAPAAADVTGTAGWNGSGSVTLRATNPDGAPLRFTVSSPTANGGTVTVGSATCTTNQATHVATCTARATYKAPADFIGQDSFTYTATDGTHTSNPATATITVNAPTLSFNPSSLTLQPNKIRSVILQLTVNGKAVKAVHDVTIELTCTGATCYADSRATQTTTEVTIPAGSNKVTFYVKGTQRGSLTITATTTISNTPITKTLTGTVR